MSFMSNKLLNSAFVCVLCFVSITVFFAIENLSNSVLFRIILGLDTSFLICNIALAIRFLSQGYGDFLKMIHHKNEAIFLSTVFVLSPLAFSDRYLNETGKMLRNSMVNNAASFVVIVMINIIIGLLLINLI